jgi:hypothetical protein
VTDPDLPASPPNPGLDSGRINLRVPPDDLSMLDILAFVVGSALASVHMRLALRNGWEGGALVLIGLVFMLVAMTATGPILLATRKLTGRIEGNLRACYELHTSKMGVALLSISMLKAT